MSWRDRAVERSPAGRRRSAQRVDQAEQIVAAASRLLYGAGDDFTVQQLVEEAGIALQTFYRYFPSKDELLLAVLEETIREACAQLAGDLAEIDEPVERLRIVVTWPLDVLAHEGSARAKVITREHFRLHQLFPDEVTEATRPFTDVVEASLEDARARGALAPVDPSRDAWVITKLVMTTFHHCAFAAPDDDGLDAVNDHLWRFCLAALGITTTARAASEVDGVPEGTPPPVFSKGRDLDETRRALEPWLAERLGSKRVEIGEFEYPAGAGVSNETLLFEARWDDGATARVKELVLRVHPVPEHQIFLEPEFRAQFDVLDVLHRRGHVRVAGVHWYEDDPGVVGQPFFVMDRLHGRVPVSMPVYNATGWLFDAEPVQRRRLWESAMDQLTRIATVPVADVALLDRPQWGATGLEQQLDYWDRSVAWTFAGEPPEIIGTIREWLGANVPARREPGLAWGDARIGNMMFGDDFEVAGVMDWEQVSLGGPMLDLGWWLLFDDYHSVDHGIPRLDGLGGRQETIDLWEDRTRLRADDLHWYEVFAGWKLAVIMIRTLRLGVTDGRLQKTVKNVFLIRTCGLLDLPVPVEFR